MDDMQKICLFLFCFKQIQLVHDMNPSGILVSFILYVTLKIVKTKTLFYIFPGRLAGLSI